MPYDYSDDVAFASEVITEFGAMLTFTKLSSDIDDADPLAASIGASVTFTLPGVGLEVIGSSFGRYVDLTDLITNHDRVMLTPGTVAQDIETFHLVTDGNGDVWKIGNVMSFEPADVPVLHFVGLKR